MVTMDRISHKQQGYSVKEIAFVCLLLGILIAGILAARVFIENSRVRQAVQDINRTVAAVFAYQDRYGRYPGDDGPAATLAARGAGWEGVIAGDVDGNLEVGINQSFTGNGESGTFWQQLKAAGFISGNPAISGQSALPENPWGGLRSVLADEMGGGLAGNKVCLSQVPGSAAAAIDNELDDGSAASGRLRATLGSDGANSNPSNTVMAEPYSNVEVYTLCYRMEPATEPGDKSA